MNFAHLHVHSHYSLLDGLSKIDELIKKAKEYKMKSLALTDHGVMYGTIEFYQKAKKAGLKPIIGLEAYLAPHSLKNKRPGLDERPYHLVLLAKNKEGYQNLIKLTSIAHLEGFYYKPRIDIETLKKYSSGLVGMSACLQGEIPRLIISKKYKKAEEAAKKYHQIFRQKDFYLEIQHHPNTPHQKEVNKKIIEISKKHNIPLVATSDIHYTNPEDAAVQDILLCIQMKKKLEDENRMSMLDEDFSMTPPEKMKEYFKKTPEAIENTVQIAEKCQLEIELGKIKLPNYKVPKNSSPEEYLEELCQKGLKEKFNNITEEIKERLEYELSIIKKTGFATYFLIVQDFVNWAKDNEIVVGPGRGSAAGSLVSYLLNITNIDPLKYNLLFERFLNPERISMPDIDMDFADTRRDEVLRYVEEKYGKDHVSQIITFGTMAARAAVRDVGRVMNLSYSYCDKIAKLIPMNMKLEEAIDKIAELKQVYQSDSQGKKLLDNAKKLEGVARHSSTHACGVLITPERLEKYVPVQYAAPHDPTIISQYSLHPIEDLGLLKMDFLGLKNLTIIETTLDIVEGITEQKINIEKLPLSDKETFKLLQSGRTTGVFQLESTGMRRYLKQLKPTELEDIIAMVSLYRPGPMEWIPKYIAGKHGHMNPQYLHPKLKPILKRTYGVAIYQEQIMQIARDLAGFTLGEADVLRKAVGKKIPKLLKEQKEKFIQGCIKNNIPKDTAKKVFAFIEPFAGYGFNRAHAACYAMIAYQTAYLKAHYPQAFMAALLTSDLNNTDRIAIEVEECKQIDLEVLPPDVNESFSTFSVILDQKTKKPTNRIRFGLPAIKNVGTNLVKNIIKERKESGTYKNLEDFLSRVVTKDLNKKSLESLIKCGALDKFGKRKQMLDNINHLLKFAKNAKQEARLKQSNIFGMMPTQNAPKLKLKKTEAVKKSQRLSWEKELLGLYISEHPMQEYENKIKNLVTPIRKLQTHSRSSEVCIGGIITKIQKVITRNNKPMLFVRLEDTSAGIEVLVFPRLLEKNPVLWQEDRILIIKGKISDKEEAIKLLADKAYIFEEEKIEEIKKEMGEINNNNNKKKIFFRVQNNNFKKDTFDRLKNIITSSPGQIKVYLVVSKNNKQKPKIIATNYYINYNQNIAHKIEMLLGPDNIKIK
ncbi:MAG: DNA polymerase III subunit alpha [Patescibacteria group bacterium]|nr:DNA polymerase III subunit alpha [Patescibacteria group bacterium]